MDILSAEYQTPLSVSVRFQRTLRQCSSPNLQILDGSDQSPSDTLGSEIVGSDADNLSHWSEETLGDRSNFEQKDDEDGADVLHSSSINYQLKYSSSHWSGSWSSIIGTMPMDSHLSQQFLFEDSTMSVSPPRTESYHSIMDTMPSESDRPERWHVAGETIGEPKPSSYRSELAPVNETESELSVSVSPFWTSDDKPSMVGAGLANLGNTCFLNSVLQCFTHTVPLVQALRSLNHPLSCDRSDEGFCVVCALRGLVELSLASCGRILSPYKLVDNLSYFASGFRRFQQEDAHEFLQCFLDRLGSSTDLKAKHTILSSQNENIVKNVFGGCLLSKLFCCNCGHYSDTYEPLIDLSLEIEDVNTLPAALESFTKVEKIEDPETMFACEQCMEAVSVEKQLLLDQAPSIAALHLKRFKNDGSFVEKIDKHVEFPLELDLLPYSSDSQNNGVELMYDLYAVVVHSGFSSTSGHYYCFIRSSPETWYKFDDSKVRKVVEEFVLSQEAYILFYAKRETPWFSRFMETEKPYLDRNIFDNSPKSVLDNVDCMGAFSPGVTDSDNCADTDTSNTADGIFAVNSSGSRDSGHDEEEASQCKKVARKIYSQLESLGNSSAKSLCEEKSYNFEFDEVHDNSNITQTPPRSSSPGIYKEESREMSLSVVRDHLTWENRVPYKRDSSKDMEDLRIKEARRFLRGIPRSRVDKLSTAHERSFSEGSSNKERSRTMELSPRSFSECSSNKKRRRAMELSPNIDDRGSNGRLRRR